jgi:hypothetical protein
MVEAKFSLGRKEVFQALRAIARKRKGAIGW